MTDLRILPAALLAALLLAGPAFAVGSQNPPPVCGKGQVYDEAKRKCVTLKAGVIEDRALADYAYALARAGRYQEALDALAHARDQERADVLNIRGYATRKLGRVEEGIGYYLAALDADPDYTLVREYLGEAYASLGRLDEARAQLGQIEARCGRTCEEYEDLAAAIAAAERRS